jgi:D-alanyl-D-alanine carboxypeptidase
MHSSVARRGTKRRRSDLVAVGLAVALVVSVSACSSSSSTKGAAPAELKTIDRMAMQASFDKTVAGLLVPGAVALVRTPAGTYRLSHGTTTFGARTAPTTQDFFRIGSVTKSMTAAVVLQLVQEGKLSLDEPIDRHIPGVPDGGKITVAQLLDMRSGLHNYLDTPGFAAAFGADPKKVWAPQDLLALGYSKPPSFPPGAAFDYSNTNTILLGLLIEKLDGRPLATVLSSRLFGPLGMTHTALPDPTTTELPQPSSRGYQYGPLVINDVSLTPDQQAAAEAGTLKPNDVTAQSPSWGWAAGAVVSTADDLMIWIRALVRGKVLDAAMQKRWTDSLQLLDPKDPRVLYGYGIEQIRFGSVRLTYHEGQLPGFNTFAVDDPTNQVSIIVWTNRALTQDEHNAKTVLVALLAHIYRTSASTPPD